MKLALILPKYGVSIHDPCFAPLGVLYISAMAKKLGHEVDFFNLNLWENMEIPIENYDAVLLTGGDEFYRFNKLIADQARLFGVKTVLGGAMASFKPQEMSQHFDSVVVGEGEGALEAALAGAGIFRSDPLPIIEIPWPDYEGFGIDEYHKRHSMKYMGVMTSRGCSFRCSFCVQVCQYRERPLADVFAEIDHYRERYGIEMLVVNDNTLNVKKLRFMEFCSGVAARGLKWSAAIRTDRFDEEMVRAAKDSGAQYFVVGVESFNQDRLDKMGKKTTVTDNVRTLDLLHKYRIAYHGNILLGFDWDAPCAITRELSSIPGGYNVFPCLLQPFIGIKAKPGVFGEERDLWSKRFREYAEGRGMNIYPEAMVQ
jgi:radical SAM superfamily enzyme YgiQ (UPF0313 family)